MISSIFKISLDVRTTASQATVTVKQGDTARRISVTLSERGKPYLISDECTAVFTAKKPDGNIIFNHCTIEDNVIHYDMTPQTSAVAGLVECEIRLYGGDGALLTGPKFTIVVGQTIYNEGDIVESATEVDALTKIISETGELRADLVRAETDRTAAEAERIIKEAARVENERGRVEAEEQRAAAEQQRENLETGYVAQAKSHADRADDAAREVLSNTTAAQEAKTVAQQAKQAAENAASNASGSAQSAKSDAQSAAKSAQQAANSAVNAARAEQNAADAANNAARAVLQEAKESGEFDGDDYVLTDEDIAEVKDYVFDELTKCGQLAPEFANSIEECTDTTKLYVLPDGFIYAYMTTEGALQFEDQLKYAVGTDGAPCNGGLGYKTDTYLSTSGAESVSAGWVTSGLIPYNQENLIRLCGATVMPNENAGKLLFYDASRNRINGHNISSLYANGVVTVEESPWDGVYVQTFHLDLAQTNEKYAYQDALAAKYVRLSVPSADVRRIYCALDEDIAIGTFRGWANTGHAFVPADYEDAIIQIEKTTANHESRINTLENGMGDGAGLPDYAVDEAESVIDRVIAAQGSRTFTFAAITDMHYGNNGNKEGVEHACQAMKYIDQRIKLDAVVVLGDFTDGYPEDNLDNALGDFEAVNRVLDDLRFAPNLRVQGNHDYYVNNFPITNRFIQSYSDDVVWGDKLGGYFYKDFADHKLRVVCVNTVEMGNDFVRCSTAQYEWFVGALDLSGKEDAKDWQILVLSHHPLDWYVESDYVFCYVLDAYKNGTSGAAGGVSFDYTGGKNVAKLIGNIHGHIHNLLTDNLYFGNVNSGSQTTVLRMCTPEACVGRENQYDGAWAESESYPKTAGTAAETSFCVYCIDLDAGTIKAICYGAGYDREVSYQYANDVVRVEAVDLSKYTHAIPTSLSMVNAIKRARQLTDVEWTPKGTIPGKKKINGVYEDYPFMEGRTYKGVPYEGGVASSYTYVGLNVDLDTFYSAVQNPRSILYTYDNKHAKGGAYYGTVCSKFAQYALNIPASFNTANIPHIEGLDTIASKGAYNEYDVKLCDIMVDTSYHTVIVTDILYDSFGRVAFIEISEAVTPTCRRLLWTPEEFNTQWVPTYRLCRYKHINDIPYKKKEYVNIESENAEIPASITDPALMPQYGDKKNNKRKTGGTMPVHILKEGYTKAVVLRDGEIISETDITNATEFTYPLGTVGHIEMYLEDANGNKSESRYAMVCQATVEVTDSSEYNDGKLGVSYTGSSGKPLYVQFNGMSEFCRLDGLGRSTIIDANNATLSFEVKRAAKEIRVAYQNEYGTYYSDYVKFTVEEAGGDDGTITDAYLALGEYFDGYGLTDEVDTPVMDEQTANKRTYTNVPVEGCTTYQIVGAELVKFFTYEKNIISTVTVDEEYQITTPELAYYMSVCFGEDVEKGAEAVVRIGATNAETDILVSETGATLADNKNLNAGSYKQDTNADYFSYIEIPVEDGASYYARGGTRIWLLDADKKSTGRTGNILSTWKKPGYFTVATKETPIAYVSIAYSKAQKATPETVYIRKLT